MRIYSPFGSSCFFKFDGVTYNVPVAGLEIENPETELVEFLRENTSLAFDEDVADVVESADDADSDVVEPKSKKKK